MPEAAHAGARAARRRPAGWGYAARFALALALLLAGCSFVSTRMQPYVGVPTFPPTDPARVEVLRSEPVRPLTRLGEVFVEPSGNPTVAQYEQALREAGAKMGADAVVVVFDRMQVLGTTVSGPWWAPTASPIVGRVVVGLAIRYSGT